MLVTDAARPGNGRSVRLVRYRDEPFVCLPEGSGLRAILDVAAAEDGFTPRVPFEAADPAGIRELVSSGLGAALLAESAVLSPGAPVGLHRLEPEPAHPPIGMITLRTRGAEPAVHAWRCHLRSRYPVVGGESDST